MSLYHCVCLARNITDRTYMNAVYTWDAHIRPKPLTMTVRLSGWRTLIYILQPVMGHDSKSL